MPTVIFDLDGTLADITHRLHHIKGEKQDWGSFFRACDKDTPVEPICRLFRWLRLGAVRMVIVSGRSDEVRGKTQRWLEENQLGYHDLIMRNQGDYRPDEVVKEGILDMLIDEGHEIAFTVDDRQKVVDMWRRRGITCLQCAAWEE